MNKKNLLKWLDGKYTEEAINIYRENKKNLIEQNNLYNLNKDVNVLEDRELIIQLRKKYKNIKKDIRELHTVKEGIQYFIKIGFDVSEFVSNSERASLFILLP